MLTMAPALQSPTPWAYCLFYRVPDYGCYDVNMKNSHLNMLEIQIEHDPDEDMGGKAPYNVCCVQETTKSARHNAGLWLWADNSNDTQNETKAQGSSGIIRGSGLT